MSYSGLLNTTCTIFRQLGTFNPATTDYGEIAMAWTQVYTGVACRLDIGSVPISQQRGGLVESGNRKLFLESTVDIRKDDRVQIGSSFFSVKDFSTIQGMVDVHHQEVNVTLIDGYS